MQLEQRLLKSNTLQFELELQTQEWQEFLRQSISANRGNDAQSTRADLIGGRSSSSFPQQERHRASAVIPRAQ
jgi:hypothetical protein